MNHDYVIRLAKEAGLYVGKNASGVTLVGHKYQRFDNTGMLVHMDVNDMARFAELIVQECIDIISPYTIRMGRPGEEYLHPIQEIKTHFGVAE